MRHLLLVSHRPLTYGGGGSVRWRYLREALPERGWRVSTVTARENPTGDEFSADPRRAGLAAARARVMGALGQAIRPAFHRAGVQPEAFPPNALWSLTGRRAIRRAAQHDGVDVVWATGPPPAALFAAVPVAGSLGLPVVAELRDLWAANPYYDHGGGLLTRIEAPALRRADAVVCVTPQASRRLAQLHPEIAPALVVLPNGFDPRLLVRRTERAPLAGRRATLIHAGTLYGDRTVGPLLRALRRPALRDRVRLEVLGVAQGRSVGDLAAARGALEIDVLPPVGWEEAIGRTERADIVVVIFTPGDDTAVPGKLYEALALGKPILSLIGPDSAMGALLAELGQDMGVAPAGDEDAIAAAVERLLDAPPAPVPAERIAPYSRAAVADRVAELLDRIARPR